MTRKTTSQAIDSFLRHKKVDGNTKIDIALLLELMHGFADEQIAIADQESRIRAREVVEKFIDENIGLYDFERAKHYIFPFNPRDEDGKLNIELEIWLSENGLDENTNE